MKKIIAGILLLITLIVMSGCSLKSGMTPKDKVKEFLDSYKNQDSDVIDNLDEIISNEYSDEYKERYRTLMINQYKNLDYKITDEIIDGNNALVTAEITVFDYGTTITEADNYLTEHEKEFYKEDSNELDNDKFLDYKLDQLEKVSDKKSYTIEFSLNYEDKEWKLESLSDSDIEKIHGIYVE